MVWRGAPVVDLGRENLSGTGRNTREGSRGFHLLALTQEKSRQESEKSKNHKSKTATTSTKLRMRMNKLTAESKWKSRVRHLI